MQRITPILRENGTLHYTKQLLNQASHVLTPLKLFKKLSQITLSNIPHVSMTLRRRLTQYNTASFSTTFYRSAIGLEVYIIRSISSGHSLTLGHKPPEYTLPVEQCTIYSTARCIGIVWFHNLSHKASTENNYQQGKKSILLSGFSWNLQQQANPSHASYFV